MSAGIEEYRSRLRAALTTINQLKAKIESITKAQSEPIAIVGMACRFPGGGTTPELFFQSLVEGVDAITEVPPQRWRLGVASDDPLTRAVRWGAFLDRIDEFDADFFGISPREAASLDPQQRLLLEVAWEALENAGVVPSRLVGSKAGVFLGLMTNDYAILNAQAPAEERDVYGVTGNGHAFPAGRLSYTLGFQGPSMVVDTACSSSLVTTHLACSSLRVNECDLALVGGVNLILSADMMEQISRTRALSPDGRCKTFDAAANGYVRGEGCGVIVLKRLSDAQKAGDPILAVIRGSAVNQDGRSTGLTTPNVLAQEALLQAALAHADLSGEDIGYVEAHGTGTALGDPIEIDALRAVLGRTRNDGTSCIIGAVKTNIGHLEAGAGLAGLIKTTQIFQRSLIPRNVNFRRLNPRIDLDNTALTLAVSNRPWGRSTKPRRAGVSAFGMSGTNAHVILEEAPPAEPRAFAARASTYYCLTLSAKSAESLRALAQSYATWLSSVRDTPLHDIAYTAAMRRTHHACRHAFVGESHEEFSRLLETYANEESTIANTPADRLGGVQRIAFVFSGQGSQWATMGKALYEHEPVFRAKLDAIDAVLRQHVTFSLIEELARSERQSRLAETEIAQPALFAIQVALAELFLSWDVLPSAVVGHSVGEIAAAHVSGALSLEEAARLVAIRGRIMQKATGLGKMVWVALPAHVAAQALVGKEAFLSIAAINDPSSVVLSGEIAAMDQVIHEFERQGVATRPLRVNYAFHSPQMDALASELVAALGTFRARESKVRFHSTVTGARLDGESLQGPYWGRNMRAPVNLALAVRSILDDGQHIFLEISPHPVLTSNLEQCIRDRQLQTAVIPTLRRNMQDSRMVLESLCALYIAGFDVTWAKQYPEGGRVAPLPNYCWQRKRHWLELVGANAPRQRSLDDPLDHSLYSIAWNKIDTTGSTPAPPTMANGPWLVFCDASGVGAEFCARLDQSGKPCIRVTAGTPYARLEHDHFRIDVSSPANYDLLFRELSSDQPALRGCILFFSLDSSSMEQSPLEAQQANLLRAPMGALYLARAIMRQNWRNKPPLWLVTRGAVSVGQTDLLTAPTQASLWGLGRTMMIELPELECTCIDTDASPDFNVAEALAQQVDVRTNETQIALRRNGTFAARLTRQRVREVDERPFEVQSAATYLITGGLGGLGLAVAQWLVDMGARHLALLGRRGPSDEARVAIQRLTDTGAHVEILQCDVASEDELSAAMRNVFANMPEIRGIVHAAGLVDDRTLLDLTSEQVWRVFAPKILGAWNLHRLSQNCTLDFFVMYSSAASLLGSPGQGNYAAANAFLDALAHARTQRGLPGMSIHWGPFADVGMVAKHEHRGVHVASRGMEAFSPAEGNQALAKLLAHPRAEIGVIRFNARQWLDFFPQIAGQPYWYDLVTPSSSQAEVGAARSTFRTKLEETPTEGRARLLDDHVRSRLGRILQIEKDRIRHDVPFQSLGVDSLMSLELRNQLEKDLGCKLAPTLLFKYPNTEALTQFLLAEGGFVHTDSTRSSTKETNPTRSRDDECIAIIGQACRFPKSGSNPESFFDALVKEIDAVSEVMPARWPAGTFSDDQAGVRFAALLDDVDRFDAAFFGISPREAEALDPQQRLLLEMTWEALENAGIPAQPLMGSRTGVFVGVTALDYQRVILSRPEHWDAHGATGTMLSTAAGRISYALGLQGPAIALDTACSSSLVAIHLACRSLLDGESNLAVAGGVNALFSFENMIMLSAMRALSPDGRCKTFDARANGYVRGEGCGMVVLKRRTDAERDGDRILALIRGSAMNQDGRSTGLTAPNVLAQQALLERALDEAHLKPEQIGYIEMHGTGTPLGDPIEAEALRSVFGKPRVDGSTCYLGAVKTNIGHLESAAGVAGLIKTIQSLQHSLIPGNLHFRTLNPRISFDGTGLSFPTKATPWPRRDEPRRAGVSSFGMSGTNAHIIVEEAPITSPCSRPEEPSAHILTISAKTTTALQSHARTYVNWLERSNEIPLSDIAYTASVRRTHHDERLAVVGASVDDIAQKLHAFLHGGTGTRTVRGQAKPHDDARIVFVFSGQGSQWATMGRSLRQEEPVFRAKLDEIDALVREYISWSLNDELATTSEQSRVGDTSIAQPAIFAIQVALAALFESWGITPHAVVGHSVGEIAAAHVSGALSLADAVRLVVLRGKIMQKATGYGKMVWVALPRDKVQHILDERHITLSVAAINDPFSVVLSGESAAIDAMTSELGARGIGTRSLHVNYAFHSQQMTPLAQEIVAELGHIEATSSKLPIYSSVTGERMGGQAFGTEYWGRNVRETVNFAAAIRSILRDGFRFFAELAPHPVLFANIQQCASTTPHATVVTSTLRRNGQERPDVLEALATLWCHGFRVHWDHVLGGRKRVVSLPAYTWQRERYWIERTLVGTQPQSPVQDPLDECLYLLQWEPKELKTTGPISQQSDGAWLIYGDESFGHAITSLLEARGITCIRVVQGEKYGSTDARRYTLDPANAEHHRALLQDCFANGRRCLGIVYSFATRAITTATLDSEGMRREQTIGCWGATRLVQAVSRQAWRDKPPLWFVTRGAIEAGGSPVANPVHATLWGLGRTLAIEHPEMQCTCVDLDATSYEEEASHFVRELDPTDGESWIALRQKGRYIARFEHVGWGETRSDLKLSDAASYVITGGLGGLGLSIAEWMVDLGARHLVLVGRHAPTPQTQQIIEKLESSGAHIRVILGDVAQRADVASVFRSIAELGAPLRGILHAAGVPGKTIPLVDLGRDEYDAVLAAKMQGTWHLHEASQHLQLDFFILYSSAAALLGLVGRASYAAANAFLDAMASWRRGRKLPGMSIQWGAFASVGMAREENARARLSESGFTGLTPAQGHQALARLMIHPQTNAVVMNFSLRQWLDIFPQLSGAPIFQKISSSSEPDLSTSDQKEDRAIVRALGQAAPENRLEMVEQHVRAVLGEVLKLPKERIDRLAPFQTLGVDSLLSLEVRNRLERDFGVRLPATLLFTYVHLADLSKNLLDSTAPTEQDRQASSNVIVPVESEVPDDLAHASGAELLELLDAELALAGKEA